MCIKEGKEACNASEDFLTSPGYGQLLFIALLSLLLVARSNAADFKLADGCLVFDYDAGSPGMKTSYSWSGA